MLFIARSVNEHPQDHNSPQLQPPSRKICLKNCWILKLMTKQSSKCCHGDVNDMTNNFQSLNTTTTDQKWLDVGALLLPTALPINYPCASPGGPSSATRLAPGVFWCPSSLNCFSHSRSALEHNGEFQNINLSLICLLLLSPRPLLNTSARGQAVWVRRGQRKLIVAGKRVVINHIQPIQRSSLTMTKHPLARPKRLHSKAFSSAMSS